MSLRFSRSLQKRETGILWPMILNDKGYILHLFNLSVSSYLRAALYSSIKFIIKVPASNITIKNKYEN